MISSIQDQYHSRRLTYLGTKRVFVVGNRGSDAA